MTRKRDNIKYFFTFSCTPYYITISLYINITVVFGVKIDLFDAIIYYFKSACGRGAKAHKTKSTPHSKTSTPLVAAETLRAVS